ncbi:LAMI_0E09736g1_1 [Lachancea mirantina]|uniref:LAMI_0E09736g1_1 n=1 Tax=Lachancea mirantina TaxID=1230905 RepID=A0A1G4JNN9_9SACH|nr:LAMI_0E09736g1_1 [Lachancea mirantina]
MSITSEELNYLIWRYLQESGKELSALALQEDTRVLEFEERFGEHFPIGSLVNFVQRGILYTEADLMVKGDGSVIEQSEEFDQSYGKNFSLIQALEIDRQKYPEIVAEGRFALAGDPAASDAMTSAKSSMPETANNQDFIKTLKEVSKIPVSASAQWSTKSELILASVEQNLTLALRTYKNEEESLIETSKLIAQLSIIPGVSTTNSESNEVTVLEWAPDGNLLACGMENGNLVLWSANNKLCNILTLHRSAILAVKWSSDNSHILSYDVQNTAVIWNTSTGTALQIFELKDDNSSEVLGVDVEWLGVDKFVIPGLQGSILVYSLGENKPVGKLLGHTATLTGLEFNTKNRMLLSSSEDLTLRIWRSGSINSSNCFYGHSQSITCAQWLDEEKVISTSMDGTVRVWSCRSNAQVALALVDGTPILCGSLSPDKTKFAIGKMDGEVTVYEISLLLDKLRDNGNSTSVQPLSIPIFGDFQSDEAESYVNTLSWDSESQYLSINYSQTKVSVISVE